MSEMAVRRTPERRVLGDLGNTKSEPVSPTANLRLLTSLASNLKSAVDSRSQSQNVSRSEHTPVTSSSEGSKLLPRKQKSLGLLCDKFLSLYPLDKPEGCEPCEISLDGTAKALGTEKRRIYDIINVLESLEMATKAGKNRYLWHGQNNLITTLIKFKSLAIKLGLREQIQEIQRINKAYTGDYCDDFPSTSNDNCTIYDEVDDDLCSDTAIKEDKSLGAMCQKFVMLFLISLKNGVINLDIAAKVLITDIDTRGNGSADGNVGSRIKTKVRRLYDIANVLTAIGLIKKIYMYDRTIRKPVFKYIGPDVECVEFDRETPVREHYSSLTGMMTPNKSCCFSEMRIPLTSSSSATSSITSARVKNYVVDESGTPVTDKRRPRKRKLFVGDTAMCRTTSSPCLDGKSRSLERLDDSILRVAEMELERLNSSEELKPKACTKLFSRYNSDSCITDGTNHLRNEEHNNFSSIGSIVKNEQPGNATKAPFLIVSKENLITRYTNESPKTQNVTPLRAPLHTTLNSSTPVRTVSRKIIGTSSVTRPQSAPTASTKSLNLSSMKTIIPRKLIPINSNGGSIDVRKYARVTHYKIEPKTKAPKIISLTNFDPKKLIPIKRSDLKISLTPVNPIVLGNRGTPGFAILTRIPAPIVSPGDTFKAVKIGNTLQLVPIKNEETSRTNSNSETDGESASNAS
ncbi:transcription factor E2F7-like [Venturia canescens]|uniref:transcription factor E2F7-like n=1 Tax=Venturia canescens TaxID=32260 RepID=UPI001C9C4154|nr:transcription factor E2F7-like [Venturia canescens]XP_043267252.1 transcription factor E2F7-like [Venturia canescens]